MKQKKQSEWFDQWKFFKDEEKSLFEDWICPFTMEDFRGKHVLECGCGGGQHTAFVAPFAASVTAVDLNTVEIARERNQKNRNAEFIEADIATMDLGKQFDVVYCVGVIHHTDNPDRAFKNIYRHCKPGGKIIIWTYSAEGNRMVAFLVEPIRKMFLHRLGRPVIKMLSHMLTIFLYVPVYTVYLAPFMKWLPYYEYFGNFRKLTYQRNVLNVFDKLNAPQTKFTTYAKCKEWFTENLFEPNSIVVRRHLGVSYTLTGTKKSNCV